MKLPHILIFIFTLLFPFYISAEGEVFKKSLSNGFSIVQADNKEISLLYNGHSIYSESITQNISCNIGGAESIEIRKERIQSCWEQYMNIEHIGKGWYIISPPNYE